MLTHTSTPVFYSKKTLKLFCVRTTLPLYLPEIQQLKSFFIAFIAFFINTFLNLSATASLFQFTKFKPETEPFFSRTRARWRDRNNRLKRFWVSAPRISSKNQQQKFSSKNSAPPEGSSARWQLEPVSKVSPG